MKKIRFLLAVLLATIIAFYSTTVTFATSTVSNDLNSNHSIINEQLQEIMDSSDENDLISIYVWYDDIQQKLVDEKTEQKIGYSAEDCSKIDFIKTDLTMSQNNDVNQINQFIEKTKSQRKVEKERVNNYVFERREISRKLYKTKSNNMLEAMDIKSDNISFVSQYAPMIILNVNKNQIDNISKVSGVNEIGYYSEPVFELPTIESCQFSSGQSKLYDNLNLSGEGIKVGMIEGGYPEPDDELDTNSIVNVGNVGTSGHATNTAKIMVGHNSGFSKNISLYSTDAKFSNIELLLTNDVKVINVSYGWLYSENNKTSNYAYSVYDKWFDHVVSYHNVTVIASAGNDGEGDTYKRVLSPAMGNNVIAVGAYDDKNTNTTSDDQLYAYSSYKNSNDKAITFGVEKPDVIMPANLLGGGTSSSAPILTSLVAQILELRPSLAIHPEIIKAIVLASCHRKVLPSNSNESTETMVMGLTEKQGAGVADGWTMAAIVCQGTYGYGIINTPNDYKTINIQQPKYGSSKMNVSISWIRECTPNNTSHDSSSGIIANDRYDLDLEIKQNNSVISESTNEFSSTEMCYVNLSSNNDRYQICIYPYEQASNTRYGYAWSIDSMRAPLLTDAGLYRMKFKNTNNYIMYDEMGINNRSEVLVNNVSDQNNLTDKYTWIFNNIQNGYSIETGYGTIENYINSSSELYNNDTSYYASMESNAIMFNIIYNDDGTCSIINSLNNTILSYVGSNLVWKTYSNGRSIYDNEKLCLEKINYIKGDANADGELNVTDISFVQKIVANISTPTNIQKFLSDVNLSGDIDISDATIISYIINDIYYYI